MLRELDALLFSLYDHVTVILGGLGVIAATWWLLFGKDREQ